MGIDFKIKTLRMFAIIVVLSFVLSKDDKIYNPISFAYRYHNLFNDKIYFVFMHMKNDTETPNYTVTSKKGSVMEFEVTGSDCMYMIIYVDRSPENEKQIGEKFKKMNESSTEKKDKIKTEKEEEEFAK